MGIIRKQSTHTTILLYIGIVVGFIGSALVRPKILSEGEIGLLQILLNTTALVSGIFTLGANLTTIKMFPKFQTEDKSNRGLLSFILLVGLVGALLSIPFILSTSFFFFENSKGERFEGFSFNQGFYIGLILVIIARLFQNVLDAYLRSYHNSVVGVFSESIILKLFPVLGLLMYYLKWIDFQQLVYFNMVVFSIPVVLTLLFLKRIRALRLVKPGPFSREEKKEMKGIAVVGLFEIISAGIILYIDTMMLQRMLGEEAVGVYTTLFFFGLVVGIPARGLVRIALVSLSESFAKNDMNTIQQVYQKGSEVLMVVGGFVFLMIWGNRYSVEMYLGPAYKEGIYVLFFIGMAQFIEISTSVNYQIISVSKHYWFNLVLALLSVCLLVVSNYFFIQWYGLVGAAIGSALSMLTLNIIRYLFLKTKYNLSPFSKNTVKCLCIFGLVFLIIELLPNATNLFVNLLYKGSVVTMMFMPLVYFTKCSRDINAVINKYLVRVGLMSN